MVEADGTQIEPRHLPRALAGAGRTNGVQKPTLEEIEKEYIREILRFTQGRKSQAAAILGISRKTLLDKRKRYHLD